MFHEANNEGAGLSASFGIDIAAITAGTTYDNAPYTTDEIDRDGFESCQVNVPYTAVLASGKTISFSLGIIDCATSGGSYSAVAALQAAQVVDTAAGGAATKKGVWSVNVNLAKYQKYVKFVLTPDLNATGTDTVTAAAVVVKAGKRNI